MQHSAVVFLSGEQVCYHCRLPLGFVVNGKLLPFSKPLWKNPFRSTQIRFGKNYVAPSVPFNPRDGALCGLRACEPRSRGRKDPEEPSWSVSEKARIKQ